MMPVAPSFKLNNLVLAILIVSSTFHFFIFRVSEAINIQLFDFLLLIFFIILLRDMLVIHLDGWIRLFLLMIFLQFFHNLFFSYDFFYSIKELLQSIELVIFYLILRIFLANQNNLNKEESYLIIKNLIKNTELQVKLITNLQKINNIDANTLIYKEMNLL